MEKIDLMATHHVNCYANDIELENGKSSDDIETIEYENGFAVIYFHDQTTQLVDYELFQLETGSLDCVPRPGTISAY